MQLSIPINDETELSVFAKKFAKTLTFPCFITLSGQLGAGKTTLVRGILQALCVQGNVKSPTFTVVESYVIDQQLIYHFDLYRIHDIEELELLGIRDYFQEKALILMEWPERAAEILPEADINCNIQVQDIARVITLSSNSSEGHAILTRIQSDATQ